MILVHEHVQEAIMNNYILQHHSLGKISQTKSNTAIFLYSYDG